MSATFAHNSLADITKNCGQMDGDAVAEFFESTWQSLVGNNHGMAFLLREMRRRFKLRPRKKQLNGEYVKIRGFTRFGSWVEATTGRSKRWAYNLLRSEDKKHKSKPKPVSLKKSEEKLVLDCVSHIKKILDEVDTSHQNAFLNMVHQKVKEGL